MIDGMLDHLEHALSPYSPSAISRSIHFFMEWVDEIHHPKEEEVLFCELIARARSVSLGPVQAMRRDHAVGRAYLAKAQRILAEGEGPRAQQLLTRYVRAFISLAREHMAIEDRALFTLCEQLIPPSMDENLLARFDAVTDGRLDPDVVRMFERIAANPHDTMVIDRRTKGAQTTTDSLDAKTLSREEEDTDDYTFASAKKSLVLYDDGLHKVIRLHDFGHGLAVQANQFLIVHDGQGVLLDPGGPKVYPNLFAETMMEVGDSGLRYLFLSHQDPDICTSLNAWLMDTGADVLVSQLWTRFLPHFGIDRLLEDRLKPIPDEGMDIDLGGARLSILPAHFLHSCGNFQLYDPVSRILFTGDLGASIGVEAPYVEDFDAHVGRMEGFHRRYMACNQALVLWANMVDRLPVQTIAPQHGPILRGETIVRRFLEWCRTLECGVDLLAAAYEAALPG